MIARKLLRAAPGALLLVPAALAAQIGPIPADMQIRLAVQAAPPALQAAAPVQGYDADGAFVTLREGTNEMICMAPNPTSERFEVSCHHSDLEAFFARGRELNAQGITGNARTQARWDEIEAGTLSVPMGTTNHIMTGSGFDPATGEILDPYTRFVIYTPGETGASLGLAETSMAPAVPWVMFPGTPGAHIMVSPPRGG